VSSGAVPCCFELKFEGAPWKSECPKSPWFKEIASSEGYEHKMGYQHPHVRESHLASFGFLEILDSGIVHQDGCRCRGSCPGRRWRLNTI
jgi:hypothetical protein